jgi:hypothetical protein
MGVSMSITKNAKYGKPVYAGLGTPEDDAAAAAAAAAADGKGEEKKSEPIELTPESIEAVKQANFDKWRDAFTKIVKIKQIDNKIKTSIGPFIAGLRGEQIVLSTDDPIKYIRGGSDEYAPYLKEDIDKYWLVDTEDEDLNTFFKDEELVGLLVSISDDQKKLKGLEKENKDLYIQISDVLTVFQSKFVNKMFEKTQEAMKHQAMKEIIKYITSESKAFKKIHKEENISGSKAAITSGDKTKEEIKMEKRNNEKPAEAEGAAEGAEGAAEGAAEAAQGGEGAEAQEGGDDTSDSDSSDSEGGDSSDGLSYVSGDDNIIIEGGKTNAEKEYKSFKKEEKADFAVKIADFMKDTPKLIKFMDENKEDLMNLYEKNKIGINVKKSMVDGSPILEKLFQEINNYTKEIEETGAAVETIAKSGEAPAAAEGEEKAPASGDKPSGDKPSGDKPEADTGDKPSGDKPPAGDNAGDKPPEAPPAPSGTANGGQSGGSGKHATITKTKKKCQPKKKLPKNINININLGKTNIAYEDTSDSDSESSSSSDSDSDSESSDSDDESDSDNKEEEEKKVVKKGKKQVKYVVNATKKKNITKRRREDNDEE